MKSHVQVAVIGGGVVGCSMLYHLTRLGWRDVMLIKRSELTSGSSRRLRFGALIVQLHHALRWQMVTPHRPAMPSAPLPGSVPGRSKPDSKRSCPSSPPKTSASWPPHGRSCRYGWRSP